MLVPVSRRGSAAVVATAVNAGGSGISRGGRDPHAPLSPRLRRYYGAYGRHGYAELRQDQNGALRHGTPEKLDAWLLAAQGAVESGCRSPRSARAGLSQCTTRRRRRAPDASRAP